MADLHGPIKRHGRLVYDQSQFAHLQREREQYSMADMTCQSRMSLCRRSILPTTTPQMALKWHTASFALPHAFSASRQASFAGLPPDPRSSPSAHVKSCTYHRWFSRPMGCKSASYWNIPMGTAKLQRFFRFRMGCHRLPIEQGRHLRLPRARRVCRLCGTGQLGDDMCLMLLECPALSDV